MDLINTQRKEKKINFPRPAAKTRRQQEQGDFDGRLKRKNGNNERIEWWQGRQIEETKNSNGKVILNSCVEHKLVVTNSYFKHKEIHTILRNVGSRNGKLLINYFF